VVIPSRSRTLGLIFLALTVVLLGAIYYVRKPHPKDYANTLIVYSYPSFLNAWGPGPTLIKNFEETCQCKIQTIEVEDSSLIVQKLLRDHEKRVDLVIGLDQLHLKEAGEKLQWEPLTELAQTLPDREIPEGDFFIPLDWAPLTFIYRKSELKNPPRSIDDLLKPEWKSSIALQDPRTSTPGLQFLSWVYLLKKDKTVDFLKRLRPNIHSVSPSWSTAYGLFKKKQAKLVFSYLTSPVYHWVEDKDPDYQPIAFIGQHPVQYEWLAIPHKSFNIPLAKEFSKYLLSDEAQKIIMEKSYMFPMHEKIMASTPFGQLPLVNTFTLENYNSLNMKDLLTLWAQIQ
jgi:thiamine transport system substrate-binding protein